VGKPVLPRLFARARNIVSSISIRTSPSRYWRQRTRLLGRRSVLHVEHKEEEFEDVTKRQKDEIYPHFKKMLSGREKVILDFGCGPGRFTPDLADLTGGWVIGVDITEELLRLAPRHGRVEYKSMREGTIPLDSNIADVVWVCLVLGAIRGKALKRTVRDINRVLRPGGLLFLVENTSEQPSTAHWAFRRREEYKRMFPLVSLMHLHDYYDLGERISVMAGRKG
jgi:SAM-dependent methyltransferase